jgi:cobalt-zinc-cadmium efflux system outer membrane protein
VACVPTDAGYQDVRRTTSTRIQRDVRWFEHDSSRMAEKKTRELLARPLTVDAAVHVALLNNQRLQAAFEELGVARADVVSALRLPNPEVDAALRFSDGSTPPDIELQATLELTDLFFLPSRNGIADAGMDAAKASVAGRAIDLAFEVRVAFWEYQAAAQTFDLRRTILEALRASFDAAQRLHEAGNVTDLSFANEQALYEESRIAYTRSEAVLRGRREELTALMGLWGRSAQWTMEGRLAAPRSIAPLLEKFEQRALERSLDLELIRRRYEVAAKRANLAAVRGWVPELRAGVAAEREHDDEQGWSLGPAASLEVPLFYQGQGESGAAMAEARQQRKLYADAAVRIRSTARSISSRLKATTDSADYYKRVLLPLRERIVNGTQLEYNAMSVGIFQLLQAKRDQIETARAYVELLRDYWTLRAQAEQLLAGRLPRSEGSLGEPGADDAAGTERRAEGH